MERLIDNFGVYMQHLQNVLVDTTKQTDQATLKGKFDKLIDASVLLRSAFFIDVLSPVKNLSLLTQKNDVCIIDIVDSVELTKKLTNDY